MHRAHARMTVFLLAVGVIAVVAISGVLLRPLIEEEWSLNRLRAQDSTIRAAAIERLTRLRSKRAAQPLVELFLESSLEEERSRVAEALVWIGPAGSRSVIEALRERSKRGGKSTWPRLRDDVRRLGEAGIEPEALIRVLEPIVRCDAPIVRNEAVAELRTCRSAAIPLLLEVLRSDDRSTRDAAADALGSFGREAAGSLADVLKDSDLLRARVTAARALVGMGRAAAPALTVAEETLHDPEPVIRGYSAEILEALGKLPGEKHVLFRASDTEARPGEEAVIEFRGDVARNVAVFTVRFELAGDVADFLRSELPVTDRDGEGAKVIHGPTPRGGGWLTGANFAHEPLAPPLYPGQDLLLVRVVLRVHDDAPPGEYALRVSELSFLSESSTTLDAESTREAILRVLPRTEDSVLPSPTPSADDGKDPRDDDPEGRAKAVSEPQSSAATAVAATGSGRDFAYHIADAHVRPGEKGADVRVLATAGDPAQGFAFSLRIDPARVRLRKVSIEGTVAKENEPDQFLWQRHVLDRGVTAVGCLYDTMEGRGRRFPAGEFLHAASVLVDIPADAPSGARIRVELGSFGDPPHDCIFTVTDPEEMRARSQPARVVDGWILVGESPLPVAREFRATRDGAGTVQLAWELPDPDSAARLERDGVLLKELPPGTKEFADTSAPSTALEYRLWLIRGEKESFPAVARAGAEPPADGKGSSSTAEKDSR